MSEVIITSGNSTINVNITGAGPRGLSAYETWLALGNVGTKQQFIDSQFDEPARIENENTRKDNELARIQNNNNWEETENLRVQAEQDRETEFNSITTAYDNATKANTVIELTNARHDNINNKNHANIGARLDETAEQINDLDAEITAIPNQTYITEKAKTVDVNNALNDIGVSQINKNKGLIDETYLSDTLKAQMAGTTAIGSTPPNASITPIKTTFFKTGKNKFNLATVKVGNYLKPDGTNGVHADYSVSDFIPVEPNTEYFISHSYHNICFYDETQTLLSSLTAGIDLVFTTPANTKYLKICVYNIYIPNAQLELGSAKTAYESYYILIDKNLTEPHDFNVDSVPTKSITVDKTDFISTGKNLFNMLSVTKGYFVNQVTGVLGVGADYSVSDWIVVQPSTNYVISVLTGLRIAFYDKNKVFISGAFPPTQPLTTPSNAVYMRLSCYTMHLAMQQLEKGDEVTNYEPYGYVLKHDLIEDNAVEIVLPPKIYALVGQEVNIYFDNIISDKDTRYNFDVTCSVGQQYDNFYRLTPIIAGIYSIIISVYKDGLLKASANSSIVVTNSTVGNGITKTVLVIGDSTTANGIAIAKLNENMSSDVMNINTIGTLGTAPNNHEGRSGWTTDFYVNVAVREVTEIVNPFYNPNISAFDFNYYMVNTGLNVPDYVILNLGINDMFEFTDDVSLNAKISTTLTQYQSIIDSIHDYNPAIKIGLTVTTPPNYNQDAFGKQYGCGQNRTRYKRNNFLWVSALINTFIDKESELIYLVPINTNLDTRYNMTVEQMQVNARNSKLIDSPQGFGGVHPDTNGYWQIADVYWFFLKSFES